MKGFSQITEQSLDSIIRGLHDGRLSVSVNKIQLDNLIGSHAANAVVDELSILLNLSGAQGAAYALEQIVLDRKQRPIDLNQILRIINFHQ